MFLLNIQTVTADVYNKCEIKINQTLKLFIVNKLRADVGVTASRAGLGHNVGAQVCGGQVTVTQHRQ